MGVWSRCFGSHLSIHSVLLCEALSCTIVQINNNPTIQCYFQTISIKNSFLSQNNMNPQFQIKMYNHSNQVMIPRTKPVITVAVNVSAPVSGFVQVQCSLQSWILLFDRPWLLVFIKFHNLWWFFFIKCPFLKWPKRLWEIWVHFQKTCKQTDERAYCTYLNSHICLTDHTHLQNTKDMLHHS